MGQKISSSNETTFEDNLGTNVTDVHVKCDKDIWFTARIDDSFVDGGVSHNGGERERETERALLVLYYGKLTSIRIVHYIQRL